MQQWRHSSFGNYYIYDLSTQRTFPLVPPADPPVTAFAKWSPTGQSIAYVVSNDLYVLPRPIGSLPVRVTSTGNTSLFNGVPDWVYEEEVFSADYALWWSPDSHKIAFLSFDEKSNGDPGASLDFLKNPFFPFFFDAEVGDAAPEPIPEPDPDPPEPPKIYPSSD